MLKQKLIFVGDMCCTSSFLLILMLVSMIIFIFVEIFYFDIIQAWFVLMLSNL